MSVLDALLVGALALTSGAFGVTFASWRHSEAVFDETIKMFDVFEGMIAGISKRLEKYEPVREFLPSGDPRTRYGPPPASGSGQA